MNDQTNLPEYIIFLGSTMRRSKEGEYGIYFRDAGQWGIDSVIQKDGKLYTEDSQFKNESIDRLELLPTTKEHYLDTNRGYV